MFKETVIVVLLSVTLAIVFNYVHPLNQKDECPVKNTSCDKDPSHSSPCYKSCLEEGMHCEEEENGDIRCRKVKNCDQMTCDKASICKETAEGPKCVNNVYPSCMDVSCPKGTRCVELCVPSRNLCVGQCLSQKVADSYPIFEQFSCTSGIEICKKDTEICIDTYQEGNFLTVVCGPIRCSKESPCPGFLLCVDTPEYLQDSFKSICVAPTNVTFSRDSCATFDKGCSPGFACHDFTFNGEQIGTDCGPSGTGFTATSCNKLECPQMLECYQRIIDGRGGLAQCAFKHTVDMVSEEIKSLHAQP